MTKRVSEQSAAGARRPYNAPELKRWGTVADQTRVGLTNPGQDYIPGTGEQMFGSVYPKGKG